MWLLKIRYWLVSKLSEFYIKRNLFEKGLPLCVVLAELYEQIEGSDNIASSQFYARIADLHFEHDAYSKAEQLYKHSLYLAERATAKNPQDIVYTMNSLGVILGKQSKTAEALQVYSSALELAERDLNASDPVIEGLKANIRSSSAAPNTMPAKLDLTAQELESEQQDQALLKAMAQLNQQRGAGQSLDSIFPGLKRIDSELDYWSSVGNTGKVKLALQKGEDVNQSWENGRTALHTAASGNHIELIKLLLSVGAARDARLTSGETALDLARAKGHQEAVIVLSGT